MARVPWERRKLLYDRLGFHFWPSQQQTCADTTNNFLFFVGGVGSGKSMTGARYLLPEVAAWPNMPAPANKHYWIIGPDYKLARPEFDFLVQYLYELGIKFKQGPNMPQDGEWYFQLANGTDVTTKSAARPETLHSVAVDGIVAAEAGQMNEWLINSRLIPRIMRVQDGPGWLLLDGTFEGSNTWMTTKVWEALDGKLDGWAAYSMPSWENLDTFPGGRTDLQIKMAEANMSVEEFMQRFGAVPMSPSGVVLKEFSAGHHVRSDLAIDPAYPVQIWVDPGRTYAVLAVQVIDNIVHVCDEVYQFDGSTERAIRECIGRDWWPLVGGGWIDVEAPEAAGVWMQGAIWQSLTAERGVPLHGIALNSARVDVDAGNERIRTLLHAKVFVRPTREPVWLFNGQEGISRILVHPRCQQLIKETALYAYPRDRVIEGNKPVDKWNHAIAALRYGCVGTFGYQAPWMMKGGAPRRYVYGLTR